MTAEPPPSVSVHPATDDESLAVRRVLDAALLSVPDLEARVDGGEVLIGVDAGRVCGAVVVASDGPRRLGVERAPRPASADSRPAERGATTGSPATTARPARRETAPLPERFEDATHVRAVAVRRRRRDSGIGTALLRAAAAHFGPLVADFDAELRPFYSGLAEEVVAWEDGRCRALVAPPE